MTPARFPDPAAADVSYRVATMADIRVLQEIEDAAGEAFREVGMDLVADDPAPSAAALEPFIAAGRAWVATVGDIPVAYLVAEVVDGALHIEQVSVHPRFGRRGIGRRLIDLAGGYAASLGIPRLTLTTYRDVPWNGSYYARLGFEVVDESLWTPGLAAIRHAEALRGLDAWPRVCMAKKA